MGTEQPFNVVAFPNAPGMITLTWTHSGEGVYWFVVEQESPFTYWLPDQDKRIWSVVGLEPNRTYRYRVCAVYDFNRVCSDEQETDWISVTTFPPEPQPVPPPPPPPPTDCGPQLPRYLAAFEPINYPGCLIRHRNYLADLTPVVSALDRADATFIIHPNDQGLVTLQSVNHPGHFLRHQDSRLKLHRDDGSDLFRQDSTFRVTAGRQGLFGQTRYESVNFPGHFIRHANFELWLASDDGSDLFTQDSTWRRLPPPLSDAAPGAISFESFNYPCQFIRHRNAVGELSGVASDLDRADATFIVRAGLNGSPIGVSLEAVNFPGHFLRHQDFRLKLHADDGSDLFKDDATFMYNDGAAWEGNGGVSFESVNYPSYFIRHTNFELWLAQNDGSDLFKDDASWQPVPARTSG